MFAAGNNGPSRVGAPGTAKNVLTIGASESVRAIPLTNFPASPRFPAGLNNINFSGDADNQNQVTDFSSIGPAQNNRRKPDVVAPGSWILSTRSTVAVADTGPDGLSGLPPTAAFPDGGTGDEDGVATHAEAVGLGLPGNPILGAGSVNTPALPAGSGAGAEQFYMYQSGTSMATPIMAGACTLIRQYLIEQRSHIPSAALIKALVVNGAVDMGMGVPHNGQGWGRAELSNSLFPLTTGRVQFDDNLDNAVSTGSIRTYEVMVSSSTNPLTVTLVWRDSQGATIQNRLHLRVTHLASGLARTADPITDIRNNVQKVIFNAPTIGTYRIEVEGVNIVSGIPEFPGAFRQDYALAIANATGFSCNPIDIVQVIDYSGSMGFSGYMEPAKERAKQLIDILQINDKAGVVSFSNGSAENFPLTAINSQIEKNDARTSITPITASGMTDLRAGLEQGRITLGDDTDRPRAIVFLSDGFHTTATPAVDDAYLDSLVAQDIKVYTIALGPDSDFDVLNNIASRTGTGAVHTVDSAADLHQLSEIYYDILGNMGCNSVVHLQSAGLGQLNGKTVIIDKSVKEGLFAVSTNVLNTKIDFTLQTPSGNIITPSSVGAFYLAGSTHQFYRITKPEVGKWKLLLKSNDTRVPITTAVLVDSNFSFRFKIDKSFLFKGQMLLFLNAKYNDKPLIGSKIVANGVYPTASFKDLSIKYRTDLDKIKIPDNLLKGDKNVNLDRLRFDKLSVAMRKEGKNIFEQKKFSLTLTDDGKEKDPRIDDGIYTAFLDIKKRKVAGNFRFKIVIEGNHPDLGDYTRTKLVSIFVPSL